MAWRPMTEADLDDVNAIAGAVHAAYPEDRSAFAERLALYPAGCHVLETSRQPTGYLISHPWRFKEPPALNVLLRSLPAAPTTFYIHDIAILPAARSNGAARQIVQRVLTSARAAGFANVSLVAVHRTTGFWSRMGFVVDADPALDAKLRSYDPEARFMVHRFA